MKKSSKILSAILLFWCTVINAQMSVSPSEAIAVSRINGSSIVNPWTGGINAAEISKFDADLDGENDDIFVFDKAGNRSIIFTAEMENGELTYKHQPALSANFPVLRNWALLRDYNCDGKQDIFTYGPNGGSFAVYLNTSTEATGVNFELVNTAIQSFYQLAGNQFSTNIYVSSQDVPAIFDFEGDGDMDILTFSVSGSVVELHLNYSMENEGICSLESFALKNRCYGRFVEGLENNTISVDPEVVNDVCNFNVVDPRDYDDNGIAPRHVGSTILAFDATQDGLVDIVLGDVSFKNLTYLENSERIEPLVDSVVAVVSNFPFNFNADSVYIDNFPAAFYEDVNGDGIRDLLVSVNNPNISVNRSSVWYYENLGEDNAPIFSLVQKNFLQDQTIDYGEASVPTMFDYNGDGLQDIVIGSRGEFLELAEFKQRLSLYINNGTADNPSYILTDEDWLGVSELGIVQYPHPSFADLDGDGDIDLVVGDASGNVYQFTNSAGAGNSAVFTFSGSLLSAGEPIDVGQNSAPQLFDLNDDGKTDLIVGERNGNLNYFENLGTATAPNFSLITDTLGGVSTVVTGFFVGNSGPNFYRFDGMTRLAVGGEDGKIDIFDNIDGNINGDFNLVSTNAFGVDAGAKSKPYISDLNGDGFPDILCGSIGGGLLLYLADGPVSTNNFEVENRKLKIYPNPARYMAHVEVMDAELQNMAYRIVDITGKVIQSDRMTGNILDISKLVTGIYVLEIESYRAKLVVGF